MHNNNSGMHINDSGMHNSDNQRKNVYVCKLEFI